MTHGMEYIRHSFTLPTNKKNNKYSRYPPNLSNEVSSKAIPLGSAKMKAHKVKSTRQGDSDVLIGDRLEDIYATLPRRQVPDFYGGDCETPQSQINPHSLPLIAMHQHHQQQQQQQQQQHQQLPPLQLHNQQNQQLQYKKLPTGMTLDDNFLSVSNSDVSSVLSDYGSGSSGSSEFDLSFRRNGRSTLYATLRRGKKKLANDRSSLLTIGGGGASPTTNAGGQVASVATTDTFAGASVHLSLPPSVAVASADAHTGVGVNRRGGGAAGGGSIGSSAGGGGGDSRRSSTSTVLSSGTGSLAESPPHSEAGSTTSTSGCGASGRGGASGGGGGASGGLGGSLSNSSGQIYGTIGRCTSKRREALPPWLCDTSTSLPTTPSLELAPTFRDPPPLVPLQVAAAAAAAAAADVGGPTDGGASSPTQAPFVQPPASRVGSLEDLQQATSDDTSSVKSFASSTSASTYSNPKELLYLRPAMLGSAPLQPSPASHHPPMMGWPNTLASQQQQHTSSFSHLPHNHHQLSNNSNINNSNINNYSNNSIIMNNNSNGSVYKSAEELFSGCSSSSNSSSSNSNLCLCRDRYCSAGSAAAATVAGAGYRVRACKTMEPLWESEDGQVQLRNSEKHKWYDARKVKHKSCPAFQAHMVAAFEQSLSNMTTRLQHLTATAEQKDSELLELRKTIEALQQQSAEAGLTKAALQSMQAVQRSKTLADSDGGPNAPGGASKSLPQLAMVGIGSSSSSSSSVMMMTPQSTPLSLQQYDQGAACSGDSGSLILGRAENPHNAQLSNKDKRGLVVRRHTFNTTTTAAAAGNTNNNNNNYSNGNGSNNNSSSVKELNSFTGSASAGVGGGGGASVNALHGSGSSGNSVTPSSGACEKADRNRPGMMLPRQLSNDSMSSVNSANSQSSQQQQQQQQQQQSSPAGATAAGGNCALVLKEKDLQEQIAADKKAKKKKGSGWLRSSFGKAFSRGSGSGGKGEDGNGSDSSVPSSPQVSRSCQQPPAPIQEMAEGDDADDFPHQSGDRFVGGGQASGRLTQQHHHQQQEQQQQQSTQELVDELRKQLRDKDMVLTDIRLEALSSAHQLDQMKELVAKLKNEVAQLKAENERLSRMTGANGAGCPQNNGGPNNGGQNSENSSACSIPSLLKAHSLESIEKRLSSSDQSGSPTVDMYLNDNIQENRDSKRIPVSVHLTISGDLEKSPQSGSSNDDDEIFIGCVAVSNRTSWPLLDAIVRKAFKEYVLKIDPASNLGLSAESVQCYHIGDLVRTKDVTPELLPCGYLVGNDMQIKIVVRGSAQQGALDALAFETLIPKSVLVRYLSLLTEHRRIILCGPSGTGKTFLAHKLAEFLVKRDNGERAEDAIATFSVDRNSQADLKGYLAHIAEQSGNSNSGSSPAGVGGEGQTADGPQVLIVDNLHHVASLSDVFNGLLHASSENCPYIIGTMNQTRCSTTNLQLSHNFRWVLCANHIEPVKGLLGRCLRRRLVDHEARTGLRSSPELQQVIEWMPQVWMHVNKFLETHNSTDATIGPRLFLSCPVDVLSAQVWFTDLWNFTLAPYLIEAAREGLQLYGQRAGGPWEDPAEWLKQSYPFEHSRASQELSSVREEDVTSGESTALSNRDSDPLLNMLMRLQEAASYSPQADMSEATAECS